MLPQNLTIVDVETTGTHFRDRIIEIGILRIENNKLTRVYSSLINPETYISPEIQMLTGIRIEDLETAPTFSQIKDELLELFDNSLFVAHNARFDYSFFKSEFRRLDLSFSKKHFCTVKLSRFLYPKFKKHNLDSLIERFNIECKQRHRALDDAKVLWDFLQITQKQFKEEKLKKAYDFVLKRPQAPTKLKPDILDNLPESPGVYIFYGENGTPLYVGKSINIKERVLSHLTQSISSSIEMKLSQQIEHIETITTAGELGALIKESQLIKKLQPLYNRRLRLSRKIVVLKKAETANHFPSVLVKETESIDPLELEDILGICKSRKQAKTLLRTLSKKYSLCDKLLGLEKTATECFSYRLGWCKGACIEKENVLSYSMRFIMAFSKQKIKSWPFKGPIIIKEENPIEDTREAFLIDKWCYLGTFDSKNETYDVIDLKRDGFDVDTYKILTSYLRSPKHLRNIRVDVKLPQSFETIPCSS